MLSNNDPESTREELIEMLKTGTCRCQVSSRDNLPHSYVEFKYNDQVERVIEKLSQAGVRYNRSSRSGYVEILDKDLLISAFPQASNSINRVYPASTGLSSTSQIQQTVATATHQPTSATAISTELTQAPTLSSSSSSSATTAHLSSASVAGPITQLNLKEKSSLEGIPQLKKQFTALLDLLNQIPESIISLEMKLTASSFSPSQFTYQTGYAILPLPPQNLKMVTDAEQRSRIFYFCASPSDSHISKTTFIYEWDHEQQKLYKHDFNGEGGLKNKREATKGIHANTIELPTYNFNLAEIVKKPLSELSIEYPPCKNSDLEAKTIKASTAVDEKNVPEPNKFASKPPQLRH